ncbi:MAG: hypothetical protein LAP21_15205 [Acidobacteriia bacterium]|nr:hypothetical protein [Terriglobia bacterium]
MQLIAAPNPRMDREAKINFAIEVAFDPTSKELKQSADDMNEQLKIARPKE